MKFPLHKTIYTRLLNNFIEGVLYSEEKIAEKGLHRLHRIKGFLGLIQEIKQQTYYRVRVVTLSNNSRGYKGS